MTTIASLVRRLAPVTVVAAVVAVAAASTSAAPRTPPGDPPGNNGTIRIATADPDESPPGSEPPVDGCRLWLEFYGFDEGQTARITFTAHPPTGDRELLTDEAVISETPAGGGQDLDAVIGYNLASVLDGLERHPQQGYHIKVTSDSLEAPGGPKQKLFWLDCEPAPEGTLTVSKAVEGEGEGPFGFELRCNHRPLDRTFTLTGGESVDVPGVPGGTTCLATETDPAGASETRVSRTPGDGPGDGQVVVPGGDPPAVITFTNVFPGAAQVAGEAEMRNGPEALATLPRTGSPAATLLAGGLWSLVLGGTLLAAARRERGGGPAAG